jgi:hypothetical protein
MAPIPCALCGALAEQPVRLTCVIPDGEEDITVNVPLCLTCSNSWGPTQAQPQSGQASRHAA